MLETLDVLTTVVAAAVVPPSVLFVATAATVTIAAEIVELLLLLLLDDGKLTLDREGGAVGSDIDDDCSAVEYVAAVFAAADGTLATVFVLITVDEEMGVEAPLPEDGTAASRAAAAGVDDEFATVDVTILVAIA